MQQELAPLLGVIEGAPSEIDWALVRMCDTEQEAIRLCQAKARNLAYRKDGPLAKDLGMSRASFNTIRNCDQHERQRYMPSTKKIDMQKLCGNWAIRQWEELYARGDLNCQRSDKEIAREKLKQAYEQKLLELG